MPRKIKSWEELVGLESEKYKLEIDLEYGCGYIVPKAETKETEKNYYANHVYLSTHTFYPKNYEWSTKILQEYGFDVELIKDGK